MCFYPFLLSCFWHANVHKCNTDLQYTFVLWCTVLPVWENSFISQTLSGHYILSIELNIWDKEMSKIRSLTTRFSQLTGGTCIPTTDNATTEVIIIAETYWIKNFIFTTSFHHHIIVILSVMNLRLWEKLSDLPKNSSDKWEYRIWIQIIWHWSICCT